MSVKATKRQRKILGEYVRWMANELELRDWAITVAYDPPADEDAIAQIRCTYGRKHATIRLCQDWFERSIEEQRCTIAHELLHCHLSGIEWQFNNLSGHVSGDLFSVMWGGLKDQIEFGVDAMADAVAKHLPLPIYGKEPT